MLRPIRLDPPCARAGRPIVPPVTCVSALVLNPLQPARQFPSCAFDGGWAVGVGEVEFGLEWRFQVVSVSLSLSPRERVVSSITCVSKKTPL